MDILVARDGEQFGPYTDDEIRDYLADGSLSPTDLAWRDGLPDWIALGDLELLCPPTRTPPPPSRVASRAGLAQALSPWTGLGAPEGPFSDASLLNGFIIIPTNLNGELTREIAAELLNLQLATPRVMQIAFEIGGAEKAQEAGLIQPGRDFELFGTYDFDEEKTAFLHRLTSTSDQVRRPEDDRTGQARTPFFQLSTPLPERIEKVTGITSGPLGSRVLQVEYISRFIFPQDMEAVLPYVLTGQGVIQLIGVYSGYSLASIFSVFLENLFTSASKDITRKQRELVSFGGYCCPGVSRGCGRATAPPRFCRARSVSCRLLLTAVIVSRFDPRPEGEGAGVQNARNAGSRWSPPARGRRRVVRCGCFPSSVPPNLASLVRAAFNRPA